MAIPCNRDSIKAKVFGGGGEGLSSERPFPPQDLVYIPKTTANALNRTDTGLAGLKLEHTGALGGDDGADGGAFVEGDEDFGFDFSELDALAPCRRSGCVRWWARRRC